LANYYEIKIKLKIKGVIKMKTLSKLSMIFGAILVIALSVEVSAQQQNQNQNQNINQYSKGFVDVNGDGINDKATDSDGDGIPNCQDPDFVRPQDGSGSKFMKGNIYKNSTGKGGYGPGDGTGNSGVGPRDGTGNGPGGTSGNCDGTGPKGNRRGGK
jgi:hypothetical protein